MVYEGIFHTLKLDEGDAHVVLKYARVVRDPSLTAEDFQAAADKPEATKVVYSRDLASILARDVRLSAEDLGAEDDGAFATDSAISRGRGGCARPQLACRCCSRRCWW